MTDTRFARHRPAAGHSIADVAAAARAAAHEAPGVFVALVDPADIATAAATVEARLASGAHLPLAGLPFAVKDNVDVAGMASTSNCPGFGRVAEANAPAVDRAIEAGAILIGKNTMDQFATGLNGTRAFEPLCRNAIDPAIIPGGSSSGSAVAVARGICAFALGSDTGGSGRVPAAANGIVGLKPTPGRVSGRGMVYCNRSFDVIPIFAATVADAAAVFDAIAVPDPLDPFAYEGKVDARPLAPEATLATPRTVDLDFFGDAVAEAAHHTNLATLSEAGFAVTEIDYAPFREAGKLVFDSAVVAERLIDYGDFIAANPDAVVPPVRQAIDAGRQYTARDAFQVLHRLAELKVVVRQCLEGFDGFVVPTVPRLYTVAEMQADPMARNTVMGTYTYFANPLGLCAIAIPGAARPDGLQSSLCVVALPGADLRAVAVAQRFETTRARAHRG
ncbi:amidase family protein [Acuticoccus sp. MNP-M23]|uniref:amidase family protein n=1 Tax=Acuticoccus sp. MNP-M23 TaxID=3072793 RepID=UPI0028163E40|nr:amidase family protein [Acuticoccus sp. MNP-M23]WMS44009.1 amidase family protein [Acuticoccus sp. MNP-M23]